MTGATDTAITDDNGHVVGVGIFDPHGVASPSVLVGLYADGAGEYPPRSWRSALSWPCISRMNS